ncbi:alpha/beta fold hydrolase [Enterococcus sp. LJL51]|uniref:alpha/beta fold hydrolase n=1 Tax=Enterococcus sp. LJL51 TaxID=3416656 RepID=UPI003CEAC360
MEIMIKGCLIHYEIFGEGKPVLCLHGFPEDHEVMVGCLEPIFAEMQGYQRIYIDLPGLGKSNGNGLVSNADKMIEIIQSFTKKVLGEQSYLLVSQSYGGYLSLGLTFLAADRIDGVFFLCPCTIAERSKRKLPPREVLIKKQILLDNGEQTLFSDFMEMAVVATDETWQRYKNEIYPGLARANEEFVESYQQTGYALSFEERFEEIHFDKPSVFLTGRQDDCVGYQDAYRLIDGFTRSIFVILDTAGHNLQIEQPAMFNQTVKNWLMNV